MKLLLVDGANLAHRAVHAVPAYPDRAFRSMIRGAIERHRPTHAAIALDSPRSWRYGAYPGYRARRSGNPEVSAAVTELLSQYVDLQTIGYEGLEADDVIATLWYHAQSRDSVTEVVVLSSDRDLLQLVGPYTCVVDPGQNGRVWRSADVMARYGVPASRIAVWKALVGCPSDDVPGVPGIGERTASALIASGVGPNMYRDGEGVWVALGFPQWGRKMRCPVDEARRLFDLSLRLTTLTVREDARVDFERFRLARRVQDGWCAVQVEAPTKVHVREAPEDRPPLDAGDEEGGPFFQAATGEEAPPLRLRRPVDPTGVSYRRLYEGEWVAEEEPDLRRRP